MKSFKEFCEERDQQVDEELRLFGRPLMTRYDDRDYTKSSPRRGGLPYKAGLLKPQPKYDPTEKPHGAPPIPAYDQWKTRQPGILPKQPGGEFGGPVGDETAPEDIMATWDIVYNNLIDQDPELKNDSDFKKMVYNKIKEIGKRHDLHNPRQILDILMQDPQLGDYMKGVSASQRGAFSRAANKTFTQGSSPLKVFAGRDKPAPVLKTRARG